MANSFPYLRLSRSRRTPSLRAMFDLDIPRPSKWCWPTFVVQGKGIKQEIPSMPGQYRFSPDMLLREIEKVIIPQGIGSVMLFGQSQYEKDNDGSGAWNDYAPVQIAIRAIKRNFPQLVVITDVCLCAYTNHGHCAPLRMDGKIDNDAGCECLSRVALSHANAGADIVAPSAMMDGQIETMRTALAANNFDDTMIMAYSTKFASACYEPFRDAENSAPTIVIPNAPKDRKGYQASYGNPRNALLESIVDEHEGADILMVKPALFYLDMIRTVRDNTTLPVAAYNVSGEYSMLIATAQQGWGKLPDLVHESISAIARSGADLIISYWASRYNEFFH